MDEHDIRKHRKDIIRLNGVLDLVSVIPVPPETGKDLELLNYVRSDASTKW
jgi:hypothetical protein